MPNTEPILLFNDECGVCRRIAHWVKKSAQNPSGGPFLMVRPIGEDPKALQTLCPDLNIWDAYATIHLLMPDGTMKLGGEAVGEVLRNLPNTRWFAGVFAINFFGFRPFQMILNLAYLILADVRPLFGCESCGTPKPWVRPIAASIKWISNLFGKTAIPIPHATSISNPRSSVTSAPK